MEEEVAVDAGEDEEVQIWAAANSRGSRLRRVGGARREARPNNAPQPCLASRALPNRAAWLPTRASKSQTLSFSTLPSPNALDYAVYTAHPASRTAHGPRSLLIEPPCLPAGAASLGVNSPTAHLTWLRKLTSLCHNSPSLHPTPKTGIVQ